MATWCLCLRDVPRALQRLTAFDATMHRTSFTKLHLCIAPPGSRQPCQEQDEAREIVQRAPLHGRLQDHPGGFLQHCGRGHPSVVDAADLLPNQIYHQLVFQHIPDAIAGQDHKHVASGLQGVLADVRLRTHKGPRGLAPEAPRRGDALHASGPPGPGGRLHGAAQGLDAAALPREARLVVLGQADCPQLAEQAEGVLPEGLQRTIPEHAHHV
mmetsp:Transcript_26912/g.71718  ORF Transcript_26912/g.71718 Transcript_26912/m.71718 type:complete len:213 (-) Transcript_26912:535-1173(-)